MCPGRHRWISAIRHGEIELRHGKSLLGGFAIPLHSLLIVLRNAFAFAIPHTHVELRDYVPLFGVPLQCRDVVCLALSGKRREMHSADYDQHKMEKQIL